MPTSRNPKPEGRCSVTIQRRYERAAQMNDPLGRKTGYAHLRELFMEFMERKMIEWTTDPTPPTSTARSILNGIRKRQPAEQHWRTRAHYGGDCWTFSEEKCERYEKIGAKGPFKLLLVEYDRKRVLFEWEWNQSVLEDMPPDSEGKSYKLLDAEALWQSGHPGIKKC